MISTSQAIITIAIAAICTFTTRALPFIIFKKRIPRCVTYLGNYLPLAIMALLIIYCLKDVNILRFPSGVPELISIIFVSVIHKFKHNNLVSIGLGTLLYMLLIQFVFI